MTMNSPLSRLKKKLSLLLSKFYIISIFVAIPDIPELQLLCALS